MNKLEYRIIRKMLSEVEEIQGTASRHDRKGFIRHFENSLEVKAQALEQQLGIFKKAAGKAVAVLNNLQN